ncbi:MAG: DNA-processing protein DprA [Candidatus Kapabacteria bacterium]|nr:DNA-processing protein DprA [Candidatus Kapabacteria bacterium]
MRNEETPYWLALAHLPRWGHLKINNLIIEFFHENKISIEEFFQLSESDWKNQYQLDEKQISDLNQAKSEIASNAFLAESFISQGFEIIPITSPEYSKTLKNNLKTAYSPAVLYVKGNKKILEEKSIAIVGSRNASETALKFTDNIAKLASVEYKVVVSGFAKGVDKQALDSAINYNGQSIIVLPQGIMTFGSGFNKYYKQIIEGNVLVLSTFFPKAPWNAGLAMARNPIIYGLADEIYVAESAENSGTWSGVVDGLRKDRKIYVRQPDTDENNANNLLIQKGAIAVDFNGAELPKSDDQSNNAPNDSESLKETKQTILFE